MTGINVANVLALTSREPDVAKLIAGDLSYKEIATKLGISVMTVKSIRAKVSEKVGGGTAAITLYCVRQGLVAL